METVDNTEKDPRASARTEWKETRNKERKVLPFRPKEKKHRPVPPAEAGLNRLRNGKKPKVDFCKEALKQVNPDSEAEAELTYYLGLAYHMDRNFPAAELKYYQALTMYKRLELRAGIALVSSALGRLRTDQAKLDDAEKLLKESIDINTQANNGVRLATDYGRLAMVYLRREEFDTAERMSLRSQRLAGQHGLDAEAARQCGNLGFIYLKQHKLDPAESILEKGLEINMRLDRLLGVGCIYCNLGWVYRARQDIKKALEYWRKARAIFAKLGMQDQKDDIQGLIDDLEE